MISSEKRSTKLVFIILAIGVLMVSGKVQASSPLIMAQNTISQIPDDRYREWEQLSPQEKEKLRSKWRYYKSLPTNEQQLLKDKYEEWKKLSPEEQHNMREKLKRWEELSPEEQETIRQRFKR